jgi:exosortase E/protease (VPEID-CTERM system)
VTFWMVRQLLAPFLEIAADPAQLTLQAPGFRVRVAPECSGLEGAGLMLAFGSVWLWLFRSEFRFPRALVLIPAGVGVVFLMNAVRIAALLWIGSAGAQEIAKGGFHSQAGWIAFNLTAFGFALAARRVPWLRAHRRAVAATYETENPVTPFLMPLLAILAAGILASSVSAGFEWLYPLRFFAAAAVLWVLRERYRELDWRVGWLGLAAGVAVFALWIVVDRVMNGGGTSAMPEALARATPGARTLWIAVRALAASVTVPIAEELAFRGFLMRRIASDEFDQLDPARAGWLAILVSSTVFGLMHGSFWHAAIAAGVIYALVYRSTRSIGEAALAHGVTNALLAVYVVAGTHWRLW